MSPARHPLPPERGDEPGRSAPIPRIIHQTWKDERIPERFQAWHASWRRLNPGFEFRLWTDAEIAQFIGSRYPEWESVMRGYRAPISRIDLARYLILHHHGGVYADLDEECLRPFDTLLDGRTFIIGTEPATHERDEKVVRRGLRGLLCPTVIASAPGHPFWEHLFLHLRAAAQEPDALDATGPFLLTRACATYRGAPITLVAPEVFYPLDKFQCRDEKFKDRSAWPIASREAFAVHYWEGTWWRPEHRGKAGKTEAPRAAGPVAAAPSPEPVAPRVRVTLYGHLSGASGLASAARGTGTALKAAGVPFTGCDILDRSSLRVSFDPGLPEEVARQRAPGATPVDLVHTNPDAFLAALSARDPSAVLANDSKRFRIGYWTWEGLKGIPAHWHRAFERVDEVWVPSHFTARAVSHCVPAPVVAMGHPVEPLPTGFSRRALRLPEHGFCFLSVLDALGNLERKNPVGVIRAYLAAFPRPGAEVFLVLKIRNLDERNLQVLRRMIGPRSDVLLLSGTMSQAALGSLVAACDAYVSLHRAEGFGLTIAEAMAAGKPVLATHYSANTEFMPPGTGYPVPFRLVALDQDSGYFRKGSRWADPDLAEATRLMRWLVGNQDAGRQTGARAAAQVRQALSPAAIGRRMRERLELLDREGRLSKRGARRSDTFAPDRKATGTLGIASIPAKAGPTPRVLVLTPMKNTAAHLDRYQRLLEALDYPREALSLAILEGDSTDDTWSNLVSMQDRLENRFSRVSLHRHDDGFRLSGPRWAPAVQRQRRAVIARARNRLLSLGLGDEAWVLWLDADLLHYPPHLLRSMLAAGKEIVVPHCLREGGGTFDRNTFIFAPNQAAAEHPEDLIDGIFQPPAGRGRVYLDRFRGRPLVEVDGVGGTALLVKADLHREGLVFPAWPHRGYIETEGLAMLARDLGIRCWGMPDLEIVHVRD